MGRKKQIMKNLEEKRNEAFARQSWSDTLTPVQRLEKLDDFLGVGVGAKRERFRLFGMQTKLNLAKASAKK